MNISISNRTHKKIKAITEFTSMISINYSNKIINKIYSTIDSIKLFPYIGRYVPELSNKRSCFLKFTKKNYLIFLIKFLCKT